MAWSTNYIFLNLLNCFSKNKTIIKISKFKTNNTLDMIKNLNHDVWTDLESEDKSCM